MGRFEDGARKISLFTRQSRLLGCGVSLSSCHEPKQNREKAVDRRD
jgi:hypothetical protein